MSKVLCVNCKYYSAQQFMGERCNHEVSWFEINDPVHGGHERTHCDIMRHKGHPVCGPTGLLFEEKPQKKSFFTKLKEMLS